MSNPLQFFLWGSREGATAKVFMWVSRNGATAQRTAEGAGNAEGFIKRNALH